MGKIWEERRKAAEQQQAKFNAMDPDLRQEYRRASNIPGPKGARQSNPGAMKAIEAEQLKRDTARAEMKRLSTEREAAISQQIADSQRMQQEMANQTVVQQEKVNTLRAEQATKLGSIRAAGTAVTQSLRILGQAGGQQAPTAAVAGKLGVRRGAKTSASSLRMGSTSQGTGSGANIAV